MNGMRIRQFLASSAVCTLVGLVPTSGAELVSIELLPSSRTLSGADATQRLLVVGRYTDGRERDVTSSAHWSVSDPQILELDADAILSGLSDGEAEVRASVEGRQATARFRVSDSAKKRPFSFAREIGGVLTRRGCNGASCHGGVKGKNGFKLSDNAEHPHEDYEWIVKGGVYQVLSAESGGPRTPRIDKENPENSLLLLKPTMQVVHGGGIRFEKGVERLQEDSRMGPSGRALR